MTTFGIAEIRTCNESSEIWRLNTLINQGKIQEQKINVVSMTGKIDSQWFAISGYSVGVHWRNNRIAISLTWQHLSSSLLVLALKGWTKVWLTETHQEDPHISWTLTGRKNNPRPQSYHNPIIFVTYLPDYDYFTCILKLPLLHKCVTQL